jgi:hypothetical protein
MTLPVIHPPTGGQRNCGTCHYWLGSYTEKMRMGFCRMRNSQCDNMKGFRAIGSAGMETEPASSCDAWSRRIGVGY